MSNRSHSNWRALIGISMLCFVVFLDQTIVITVLPGIQRDLQATVGQLQWVMNAFFVAMTAFMVTMGRLADIYGRRRALCAGALLFAVSSMLAGLAWSPVLLIACRALQGVSGAIALACGAALVVHQFPANRHSTAIAIFMSITGFGLAVGPVAGGLLMTVASWRWVFFVSLPFVLVGLAIAHGAVRETERQTDVEVDLRGLSLLTPGLIALVLALMEGDEWGWTSPITLVLLAVGLACMTLFVPVERRVSSPMIDFTMFRSRLFVTATIAVVTLGGFIGLGSFLAPLYLQTILNAAPFTAGLMLLPISGLVVLVPPLIGGPTDRLGTRPFLIAGQAALALSALAQLLFLPTGPVWLVLVGFALFGLGWGLQSATAGSAVSQSVPASQTGSALGALYSFSNLGACLGLAIGGLIFQILDRRHLDAALLDAQISIDRSNQEQVRSLLSDPSRARETLSQLAPNVEIEILPLFQNAFMAGFDGAMGYLLVICGAGMLAVARVARRPACRR